MKQGFPGGSVIDSTFQGRGCGFLPWVRKIPWRRKWQPTPVFLPGKSYGQRSLVDCKRVGHKLETKQQLQQLWIKSGHQKQRQQNEQTWKNRTVTKRYDTKNTVFPCYLKGDCSCENLCKLKWCKVKKTHLDNRFTKSIEIKHRCSQTWLKAMVAWCWDAECSSWGRNLRYHTHCSGCVLLLG